MTRAELVPVAFVDEGLGNSSYLLDLGDRRAVVVDPARDATPYLAAAERAGLSIAYTVETHLHADFLTGSRELAARGATVLAPRAARIEWPHRGFGDGDEVGLGGLRLRAIATPGHTPEHLSWLLADGDRPVALFSGGALLVDAVARTDLIAPQDTEPLARSLWRSLHERILSLPDDVAVYPTHGAGSFCAAPTNGERTTTIGRERAANPMLAAPDEDAFVAMVLAGYGSYPPYFLRLRERNRQGPDVLGSPFPPLSAIDAGQVKRHVEAGAVIVDARPVTSWAAGHIRGALSIPLRPPFASWLGWLVADDRPLVFAVEDGQDTAELVRQARNVGYERLVGTTAADVAAWREAGLPVATTELIDARRLDRPVIDVRQSSEHALGHVPGAVHVELGDIARRADTLPTGTLAVMCAHGERAAIAASLLEQAGRAAVSVVIGGPDDWAAGGRKLGRGVVKPAQQELRLGLRANLAQFGLLVAVNALVGGMVGQERTVLPLIATRVFHLHAYSAVLTYIVAFGVVKAATNFLAGTISERVGRKPVLVTGWLVAVPVPFLLAFGPSWAWIVMANVLLGVSQGLTWSTTVIMKIDLVGPARRGLAMGFNEAAGYAAVAVTALATGFIAARTGLRPDPFFLGAAFASLGLGLSTLFVRETTGHARHESQSHRAGSADLHGGLGTRQVFVLTSFKDKALSAASQAGLVNNLNDGLAWGIFPLFFARAGLTVARIGLLVALYPAVWGAGQLATGALSDRLGRKRLIAAGMWTQAAALGLIAAVHGFWPWAGGALLLGVGTAMVYPTLLAAVGDVAHPSWRASAVGVYRLWRDTGFALGALLAGVIADTLGLAAAILVVAGVTAASGVVVAVRMYETHRPDSRPAHRSAAPPGAAAALPRLDPGHSPRTASDAGQY